MALPRLATYVAYLQQHAEERPTADAMWFEGRTWSYRELEADVDECAARLVAAGVSKGDRIAVLSTPRPEYFVSLIAAARIGAIWVGLNPRYSYRELAHVVEDAQPRVILSLAAFDGRSYVADVGAIVGTTTSVLRAFRLDEGEAVGALERLPDPVPVPHVVVEPDAPAVIVYTSGSSGTPKGAVLSHRGLVDAARAEAEALAVDVPRVPCNLPVNHIACIVDLCGTTLVAGGMIAMLEHFEPAEMLSLVAELGLTNLMSVPTVIQMLTTMPEFATADLGTLRKIVWGGAPLPIDVIRLLRSRGIDLMTVYGMTETIASVTFTRPDATDDQLAETVGMIDPEIELRLCDEDDAPVDAGERGEVQVRSGGLFLEYFGRADATDAAFTADGWFRTGDIGVLRADGCLRLVGRRSDMFKSGGYNVYPREVELVLEGHRDVEIAVVVSRPDDTFGEVGVAFVRSERGEPAFADELRAHSREGLANYKVPKEFVVVDDIPLLPVGKVDKQELRRRATALAPTSGSSSSPHPMEKA